LRKREHYPNLSKQAGGVISNGGEKGDFWKKENTTLSIVLTERERTSEGFPRVQSKEVALF